MATSKDTDGLTAVLSLLRNSTADISRYLKTVYCHVSCVDVCKRLTFGNKEWRLVKQSANRKITFW